MTSLAQLVLKCQSDAEALSLVQDRTGQELLEERRGRCPCCGATVLMSAVRRGFLRTLEHCLMIGGVPLLFAQDRHMRSAIRLAVRDDRFLPAVQLLVAFAASCGAYNQYGGPPYHYYFTTVLYRLLGDRNGRRRTAEDTARRCGSTAVAAFLAKGHHGLLADATVQELQLRFRVSVVFSLHVHREGSLLRVLCTSLGGEEVADAQVPASTKVKTIRELIEKPMQGASLSFVLADGQLLTCADDARALAELVAMDTECGQCA